MKISALVSHILVLAVGFAAGIYWTGDSSKPESEESQITSLQKNQKRPEIIKETTVVQERNIPVSKATKPKFFKTENRQSKARALIRKTQKMDHHPSSGEPNRELIQTYEEALELDPNNKDALQYYSNYLVMFDRTEDAVPLLKRCISLYKNSDLCHSNLANHYANTDNHEERAKTAEECLAHKPKSVMCLNHRANYFLRTNQAKKALKDFLKMEDLNGTDGTTFSEALIYLGIAQSYEKLKNVGKASEYYRLSCNEGQDYACKKVDGES